MITLTGSAETAFGSFVCFRGFAPIGLLADISRPDGNYQRSEDDNHVVAIQNFLTKNKEGHFFPGVILGASWQSFGVSNATELSMVFNDPAQSKTLKFNGVGVKIAISKPYIKDLSARVFTLGLDDEFAKQKPLFRIDGNHRLLAVENLDDDSSVVEFRSRKIPFCLVMFLDESQYEKNGALFFHNINYKAAPMPEEHNLRIILERKILDGDEYLISNEYLQTSPTFGWPYFYARQLTIANDLGMLPNLSKSIGESRRTFFLQATKLLIKSKLLAESDKDVVKKFDRWLISVENALEDFPALRACKLGMLVAVLGAASEGRKCLADFCSWLSANKLATVAEVDSDVIWDIYMRIHRRGPYNVFVAMPFLNVKHVNDFNKLFEEVLQELSANSEDGIKYELTPIMRFRGAAQRIDQRLIQCIKKCDIFIADITKSNRNVIFEVGLAEGYGKPILLIRSNSDDKEPLSGSGIFAKDESADDGDTVPFDMDKLQWIPYSATGYYNDIKGIIRRNLPEMVKMI